MTARGVCMVRLAETVTSQMAQTGAKSIVAV
jgi:hypothetical protein